MLTSRFEKLGVEITIDSPEVKQCGGKPDQGIKSNRSYRPYRHH